ncbi:MAG: hypothetical protein DMG05_09330 [Acidobacteria bacterium]|nr:MAG: hypothetical protein DMG05_09330 [Acidobacteriota bacterium]
MKPARCERYRVGVVLPGAMGGKVGDVTEVLVIWIGLKPPGLSEGVTRIVEPVNYRNIRAIEHKRLRITIDDTRTFESVRTRRNIENGYCRISPLTID